MIRNTSGGLIQTVFSPAAGDPLIQTGPNSRSVDVTALLQSLAGQTVVLAFETQATHWFITSWFDDVSLITDDAPSNTAPVASCQAVTEECTGSSQAAADIDNGSTDAEGPITLIQDPNGPYSLGNTLVELTATDDGGLSDSCSATVTVVDTILPTISVSGASAECTGALTEVSLGGAHAGDSCQAVNVTDNQKTGYALGDTTVTFTATEVAGSQLSASADATVSVVDTTDPVIASTTASPNVLWPPNHKMKPVTVSVDVSDACNGTANCVITGITSNEGPGDYVITGDLTADLRAERSGSGSGRVYTITVTCTDPSGNSADSTVTVSVPHDQGNGKGRK